MGSTMAKPSRGRRPFSLEVGFEGGRGGRDALGRADEGLLPSLARSLPPGPPATHAKGAHHESPASQSGSSLRRSATNQEQLDLSDPNQRGSEMNPRPQARIGRAAYRVLFT